MKNRKYTKTKKNKGIIPEVKDKRVLYVPVACGNCMECRKMKGREWTVRLSEEIRNRDDAKFVTLTFSDESLEELGKGVEMTGYNLDNEIATMAVRRFTERWRKKYKKTIRHWLVTELGQNNTERIHLHGLVFTEEIEEIKKKWGYGEVWVGEYVNMKTINYIVKYVSKSDELHKEYKSKILSSKGIGKGYIARKDSKKNRYKEEGTKETYVTRQGVKLALPIYYRNHIYDEEEKERLWLEKLDEEARYVDGAKVSIKNGEEEYYKVLEEARKKNKRLGYGDDSVNWERKEYENNRRNMKKLEEIGKNLGNGIASAEAGQEP